MYLTLSGVWCSIRHTGVLSGEVHTRIHPSMYPQLNAADHNNRSFLALPRFRLVHGQQCGIVAESKYVVVVQANEGLY